MEQQELKIESTIDNGEIENVQIAPIGDFVGSDHDGNPISEKLDYESLKKIADELNEESVEVLGDVDHGAAKHGLDRNTKAAGWWHRFVVDPIKGLFANLKLTRHGKELVENREFRFVSPTFTLDEDGRPIELHSVSLTNTPAFKGSIAPILNAEASETNNDENVKGTIKMEITKEELVALVKQIIAENCAPVEEAKNEEPEPQASEAKTEEVEPEASETKEELEVKNEDTEPEAGPEAKEPEAGPEAKEPEEVIKLQALNAAPTVDVAGCEAWRNLHGDAFWTWLAKHPDAMK